MVPSKLRRETRSTPNGPRRESIREYLHRQAHTTGSAFVWAQRRCNDGGLSNAEWNALSPEQRRTMRRGMTEEMEKADG